MGLVSFIPGGFHAPGFYDSIALNRVLEKTVVTDQTTIIKNVDTIVADINSGKSATDFKSTDFSPFCSIMNEEGEIIVHPVFPGINVKQRTPYIYNEIVKGTVGGTWVNYPVRGKLKHVYV